MKRSLASGAGRGVRDAFLSAYRLMAGEDGQVQFIEADGIKAFEQLPETGAEDLLVYLVGEGPIASLNEMHASEFTEAADVALRRPWHFVRTILGRAVDTPLLVLSPPFTSPGNGACSSALAALEFLIRGEAAAGAHIGFATTDDPIAAAVRALSLTAFAHAAKNSATLPLFSTAPIASPEEKLHRRAVARSEPHERVLITGGGGEIAVALCRVLDRRRRGTLHVLLLDKDDQRLAAASAVLRAEGIHVLPFASDLAESSAAEEVVSRAQDAFGGLDAVFAHAGVASGAGAREISNDEFDRVFAVNLHAAWALARASFQLLAASGGTLTVTSSIGGLRPGLSAPVYSASKAALVRLAEWLAVEWAPSGVRVNAVSPGSTLTPMNRLWGVDDDVRAAAVASYPMRRMAAPAEIAEVMAFIASPEASYVSGHNLVVDGALSRLAPHG